MYPLVAEGIVNGLFIPNRASTLCSYCPYTRQCEAEYGGYRLKSKRGASAQPVAIEDDERINIKSEFDALPARNEVR
jgi:hypothetical protein